MHDSLFSLQLERHFLGGLIKFPEIFAEVDVHMSEKDFINNAHATIYLVLKQLILKNEPLDKVVISKKITDLGIKFKDDINVYDYIENLTFTQITQQGALKTSKELIQLRMKREIVSDAKEVEKFVVENPEKPISEIIAGADSIYNRRINSYKTEDEPVDLLADLDDTIDRIAANPVNEVGLMTPYNCFNNIYGGLRAGNGIYCVISRAKAGKSTWLMNMAMGVVMADPNVKVLILDTEMTKEVSQFRVAASMSGVPYWFFESGNWIKNRNLITKREDLRGKNNPFKGKIFHMKVPNKTADELCSIAKRWYYNKVGRGNKALVILDYIKMANEKLNESNKEYQVIGDKINKLNELGFDLNIPLFAAMQMNRSGAGKFAADDETAISMSDRISWLACWVGIFRKKRVEEIQEDGIQFGTHKLIHLVSRFQGRDGFGTHDLVKTDDGNGNIKYRENFINYEIQDFKITEKGTLQDVIDHHNLNANLADKDHHDDGSVELGNDKKDLNKKV